MTAKNTRPEKMIIAGPCALESREQLKECVKILKQMDVKMIRASLWKPRTQPGWDGLGWMSLPLLLEETIPYGVVPATEIITAEHALMVVHALERMGNEAEMIVWLGSRNQNHIEQKKIAKILATGTEGLTLIFKNQMWEDLRHWIGIQEHIISEGFPKERLIACHRGFSPGKALNPKDYRNLPDFEMAMQLKQITGLPMVLDPSHIGGTRENVVQICKESCSHDFDGYLIEMHCDHERAKTDAKQQLSPEQLEELLPYLRGIPLREKVA